MTHQIGLVGWRGMVGSVLLDRMLAERDFDWVEPVFFSTSQAGRPAPDIGRKVGPVQDANDLSALARLPMLISTQGGDYTQAVHARLRAAGWQGYWIDAASTLRMEPSSVIVLDPVNLPVMQQARAHGIKDFIGGNCTVSLMLMAVCGLLRAGVVEWITAMTYQSASGAGAQHMRELLEQMGALHRSAAELLRDPNTSILDIDRAVTRAIGRARFSDQPIRGAAGCEPHPLDRQGFGQRPEPGGVEGRRRVEQDHGHRGVAGAGRRHLRAGERHALSFAGAHHQAQRKYAVARGRTIDRRRQPVGEGCAQ